MADSQVENAIFLGIDTGGTYTDAVLWSEARGVIAKAKALTTRHDLSVGISGAVERIVAEASVDPGHIRLVSMSTTLATNALVEGQGGRIALVMVGFSQADLEKADLGIALGSDPVVFLPGGHDVYGRPQPFDTSALQDALPRLKDEVTGFAVCAYFAVRNPEHEIAVRDLVRSTTGLPVTCSHELSAKLNGPRRALTTVLNARLIAMIDRLVAATEGFLDRRGIHAPLMVVRGDGALVSAAFARHRPIETILSGPAASLVGARHMTGLDNAIVSDIGGTTTDVAVLDNGRPRLDPNGATVGGFRTMVEAVAMRTFGLGGDSEVSLDDNAMAPRIKLGPRRLVPLSLLAANHGAIVIDHLVRQVKTANPGRLDGRFALLTGVPEQMASGLSKGEAELYVRITREPQPLDRLLSSVSQTATINRLVARGLVHLSGFTPSDACHVLNLQNNWNGEAARHGAILYARRKDGAGRPLCDTPEEISRRTYDALIRRSSEVVLETVFAEDGLEGPEVVANPLIQRALSKQGGIAGIKLDIDRPLIGLGASAPVYYPAVGTMLGTRSIVPVDTDVANALGAVVGQVRVSVEAHISQPAEGIFRVASGEVMKDFQEEDLAVAFAEETLQRQVRSLALEAGTDEAQVTIARDVSVATVEDQRKFIEAVLIATATGRPRIAH
ncbi:hydantoinase/oxoprolinase N-terminal domain-containing protein [Phyllobacterium myrsinacearum]|uniref:N-methylhydantoinase A/oxoprolinase/acetone carboxylase beta subunit n=1 Tax=Phyllobacterium myrsinacearum TaxID=28101 RepID=A0A839EIM5_9HYPH|nr:hydantoinase/oxoprolinase family protein [Phyllobacterium myrsinacearum]MBA8877346.1 N-methylhydantoinase A/oxoprolinase/acetone carboxylase beta subunit [Phyllobacterium myrsinacearum]